MKTKNKRRNSRWLNQLQGKICLILMLLFAYTATAQNTSIKGEIKDCAYDSIYLAMPHGDLFLGTEITDGAFKFALNLENKSLLHLGFNQDNMMEIIASPGENIQLNLNASLGDNPIISGSPETEFLFETLNKVIEMYLVLYDYKALADTLDYAYYYGIEEKPYFAEETYSKYLLDKEAEFDALQEVISEYIDKKQSKITAIIKESINTHLDYLASAYLIEALSYEEYAEVYKMLDASLLKKYPDNQLVQNFHESYLKESAFAIGTEAPDFTQPGKNGKDISLSSLKGKVVLIDFWASWCGPCHDEIPNLITAYDKYKDHGFEILSVSLDNDKERWLSTIKEKSMGWLHAGDMLGWKNEAAAIYDVEAIPYTVLLDEEGKILAKGLRGKDLEAKLSEIFK